MHRAQQQRSQPLCSGQPVKTQPLQLLQTYLSRWFFTISTQCALQWPWKCPSSNFNSLCVRSLPWVCLFKQKGGFTLLKKGHGTRSMSIHFAVKSRDTREKAAVRTAPFVSLAFFWWCQSLPVAERSQRSPNRDVWSCPSVQDEVCASSSSRCPTSSHVEPRAAVTRIAAPQHRRH